MQSKIEVVRVKSLMDRSGPKEWIADNVPGPVSYLRKLADYGVDLLQRSFVASERETWDVVLLPTLFRQVIVCLDSIHLQLRVGAVRGAIPSLRSLFEAELSIEWILTQGKERWGRQFYVAELRQQRVWKAVVIPGTPENQELLKQAPSALTRVMKAEREAARDRIQKIDEHIAENPEFQEINGWFEAEKKKKEPDWFVPGGGPRTRRQMAKKLGRLAEYDVWYGQWSEVHHASRTRGSVAIPERGRMFIEPIRDIEGLAPAIDQVCMIAERTFLRIIDEYRPDDPFRGKLAGEWKELRQVPEIVIQTKSEPGVWV